MVRASVSGADVMMEESGGEGEVGVGGCDTAGRADVLLGGAEE